mgnify:CR=1 FL=1
MTKHKIHWAGGLTLPRARMLPGWPCCCCGRKADDVRRQGNQTWDIGEVTCKACLKLMKKRDDWIKFKGGVT